MLNVYSSSIFGIQWLKSDLPIIIVTSVQVTSCRVSSELSPLQKIQTSFVKTRTRQRTCQPFVRSCILLTTIRRSRRRSFDRVHPLCEWASSDKSPLTIAFSYLIFSLFSLSLESNFCVMLHLLLLVHQLCCSQGVCWYFGNRQILTIKHSLQILETFHEKRDYSPNQHQQPDILYTQVIVSRG